MTEAATNAVKYGGAAESAPPSIKIEFGKRAAKGLVFTIWNTLDPRDDASSDAKSAGTGFGTLLIKSLTAQLGGDLELRTQNQSYALYLRFDKLPDT